MTTTTYSLYLESGPKRRKTMVHALDLLGCVATGPTTDEALADTPEAIRAYLRFLARHGETVEPDAPFETCVVEHITEGDWLGNGSPYIVFGPDLEPLTDAEIETCLSRARWLCDDIADWLARHTSEELDATPSGGGRTARAIALHVLGAEGSYLAAALGGAPGFSRLHTAAERGEIALPDALRRAGEMVVERARATTPEERAAVRQLSAGPRTFHKALRRTLEHSWEHLAELERRR
ncbi:MAG TPA: DinB family protein [Ktedonobacterales bacterium]|nr:DinB family protein [Ktedonobacterales bacterium]